MAVHFPDPPPTDSLEIEINNFFDHIIDRLNTRRLILIATARDARLDLEARSADRVRTEKELDEFKSETECRLKMNELRETQVRILEEIEGKQGQMKEIHPETRLTFRHESGNMEQLIRDLGEIIEEEVPYHVNYQDMRPIVAVGKRGQAPGELCCPKGVAVDLNSNQIYVAEGDGIFARISIFSSRGEFLNAYTHDHMKYPWGIAIHRDNIYITDREEHTVFHLKIGVEIRLVSRLGSKNSEWFNAPRQLAISNKGDVYVSDYFNHRIQILDYSLNYQRKLSHESMKYPRDVKLTNDEVYALTEKGSPCVHVFSFSGDKIRSLVTYGVGMQVICPFYFCLDANQNLIFSDWGAHQIKIFLKEGTLLHTLGQRGHEIGMFEFPLGVALTSDHRLVVISNNVNFRLQIYSSK